MKLKFIALLVILLSPSAKADVDDFDFDFAINGDRSVRPLQVFTNGEKTYFQFKNPQNPPVMIANGRVVRFAIEEPYTVVTSLDSSTSLIGDGGRYKAEVKYNGKYSLTKFSQAAVVVTTTKQSLIVPVQEVKPKTNVLATESANAKVNPVASSVALPEQLKPAPLAPPVESIQPKVEKSVVTAPAKPAKTEFSGEFVFFPAKIIKAQSVSIENKAEPVIAPQQNTSILSVSQKSFFLDSNHSISNEQIKMLRAHVASGGAVELQGSSGVANPESRIKWANARANKTKDEFISLGISASAIKVNLITQYPNTKDMTGVSVALSKGSLT